MSSSDEDRFKIVREKELLVDNLLILKNFKLFEKSVKSFFLNLENNLKKKRMRSI